MGADVEHALQKPQMLHARIAAIGTDGTLVGDDLREVDAQVLQPIGRGRHLRPDDAAQRLVARISAAIVDVPGVDGENHAVFVERHARVAKRALVAVRARGHVLGARLRPLDGRAVGFARRQRADRHLRIVRDLDPKAAANVVRLHPHLVHAQMQRGRQQLNADGGKRIVAPEIEALVVVVPLRDDRVVLQRRAGEAMHVQVVDVNHVRRFGERLLHLAILKHAVPHDVRPHRIVQDGLVRRRDFAIDNRIERLVIDSHEFSGVFRDRRRFGDDRRHRLALIARAVNRHRVIKDLVAGCWANLEKRINELGYLVPSERAHHAGHRFCFRRRPRL